MGQPARKPVQKQRVSNSERRRTSIRSVLDAALSLFVTRGYDATRMDDIAAQAGLTKGAVYFYFKDKLALATELLKRSEAELFDPIFQRLETSQVSATERIVMLTNWLARIGAERIELPLLHVLMSLEFHGRDNVVELQLRETYRRLHEHLEAIVKEGQRDGEFTREAGPKELAAVLVALIDGMLVEWRRYQGELDGARLARSARLVILGGICRS